MPKRENITPDNKAEIVHRWRRGEKVGVIGADYGVTGSTISNIVGREGGRVSLNLQCPHCQRDIGLSIRQDRVKYGRARDR